MGCGSDFQQELGIFKAAFSALGVMTLSPKIPLRATVYNLENKMDKAPT